MKNINFCKRCGDKLKCIGDIYCDICKEQIDRYDKQFDFDGTGQDFEVYG